jgi:hypothetical protein
MSALLKWSCRAEYKAWWVTYVTIPPHEQRLNLRWQDAQKFNLCSWGGIVPEKSLLFRTSVEF